MARDGERGRGDWKARLGSHNSGPYADDSGDSGPVDIVAVRRDDALIDAIASDGPVETASDEEFALATLLAGWRSEIVDEELPAGPDLDDIVAAVNQEIGARQVRAVANKRGHLRLVRPLMGAAAAIALIAGGMTAFSYSAQPGDPLWKVKEVVFSEQAQATIANTANDDLTQAQMLIQQRQYQQAAPLLAKAKINADQINDSTRKQALNNKWDQVWADLNGKAPDIAAALLPTGTSEPSTPSAPTSTGSSQPVNGGTTTPPPTSKVGVPTTQPPATLPGGFPIPTLPTLTLPPTLPGGITLPTLPGQPTPTHSAPPPTSKPTTVHPTSMQSSPSTIAVEPTVQSVTPTRPAPVLPTTFILPSGLLPGGGLR